MDAVEIIEEALHDLEHSKITCGEFDRIVEPFRDCVPVKHGKWFVCDTDKWEHLYALRCSECSGGYHLNHENINAWNYCPNCGSDMREEE